MYASHCDHSENTVSSYLGFTAASTSNCGILVEFVVVVVTKCTKFDFCCSNSNTLSWHEANRNTIESPATRKRIVDARTDFVRLVARTYKIIYTFPVYNCRSARVATGKYFSILRDPPTRSLSKCESNISTGVT